MHITHLVTRLLRAGSEENTLETCRWQLAEGHRVSLIHGAEVDPWWDANLPEGIERVPVPEMVHAVRPVSDFEALRVLRRTFQALQPDVIHTHQSKAGVLGRLAARVIPDAVVAHGIHIVPFEGVSGASRAFYLAAEKLVARHTDVFIGVSSSVGEAYVKAGVTRRGRVHCVRSGMDLARFHAPVPPEDWRELLGVGPVAEKPPVVLMLAALEKRKRHIPFLQALAASGGLPAGAKLVLAGAGPEEKAIRQCLRSFGLEPQVCLAGHRTDPEALLALADITVLVSEKEGLPRVVVQSIAAGRPVVATELPGLREILRHGENGFVTSADGLEQAARELQRLLGDAAKLQKLRNGALATDVSDWDLDLLGSRTTALYGLPVPVVRQAVAA